MAEFALIDQYFRGLSPPAADVVLGIGDDAALVQCPAGHDVVSTSATLAAQSQNAWADRPESMGHRLVSSALNRLTATGAQARWATLALTMAKPDSTWLEEFRFGLSNALEAHRVALIGGDTTSGPLAVSLFMIGSVPAKARVSTQGAAVGDLLAVTGPLATTASAMLSSADPGAFDARARERAARQLAFPTPRVDWARLLADHVHAAVDLTDGFLPGLERLLNDSGVGVTLDITRPPLLHAGVPELENEPAWRRALSLGGDHELCLALPATGLEALEELTPLATGLTTIGTVVSEPGLRLVRPSTQTS